MKPRYFLIELLDILHILRTMLFPAACRFVPTCFQYAEQALERRGVLQALPQILGRLLRCHPFHPGGYDPVL